MSSRVPVGEGVDDGDVTSRGSLISAGVKLHSTNMLRPRCHTSVWLNAERRRGRDDSKCVDIFISTLMAPFERKLSENHLTLDPRNSTEKISEPLIKQEGVVVEHLSTSITLVSLIPCQKCY